MTLTYVCTGVCLCVCRQIEENLISRHEAEGEVSTLKGKMAALEQDNILLREKINHLRLEILEYSAKTAKHTSELMSYVE